MKHRKPTTVLLKLLLLGLLWNLHGCKSTQLSQKGELYKASSAESPVARTTPIHTPSYSYTPIDPKAYRGAETRYHDLLHTKLEVSLDWEKRRLNGVATLRLKPYFFAQEKVVLDAKGFDIQEVRLMQNDDEIKEILIYEYDQRKLTVLLDKTYTAEENFLLQIVYTAKPYETNLNTGSASITDDKGLYFIMPDEAAPYAPFQAWTQGETTGSSCWFPTLDTPNERCTQELYLTVEKKYTTLANGMLVTSKNNGDGTRTDYWKMSKPHAPYLFAFAVGEYEIVKDKYKNLEVSYYVEPDQVAYAKDIFGRTPEMLDFFQKKLGISYPWEKYGQIVVRDFVSGAMENTTATIFMEDVYLNEREKIDENWDYIIAHELFHQWFGDLVTCRSWANLTLNEAFATYSEYLWTQEKYGKLAAEYHFFEMLEDYLDEAVEKTEPVIRYQYANPNDLFDAHSYNKGGRILMMLHNYLGDEAFWAGLKNYLQKNAFKDVEIHHLRQAFEEVVGEDLHWFFDQWFLAPGHPQLSVVHQYNAKTGKLKVVVRQVQQKTNVPRAFVLPLKIAIWENGQRRVFPILIDKNAQEFNFELSQAPQAVIVDAEQILLGTIDHLKTIDELRFQFEHETMYVAQLEAVAKASDLKNSAHRRLLLQALQTDFWAIREQAISLFDGYGYKIKEDLETVRTKLQEMALQDPHPKVRTAAIDVLASLPSAPNHHEVFEKAVQDSSYTVAGAALAACVRTKHPNLSNLMAQCAQETHESIVIIVAEYYLLQNDPAYYDWFTDKIFRTRNFTQYDLLLDFGEYLAGSTPENKLKGVKLLEIFARKGKTQWAKLAAFKSLNLLSGVEGVKNMIKDILQSEFDQKMLELYKTVE